MPDLLQPEERVLSTLNADGTRNWLTPRVSQGALWKRRRAVGYTLIVLFVALPHLRIGGKPPLLFDILNREFTVFGATMLPTDTVLFALSMLAVFVLVFMGTALLGRVWCGWGCPQTVYLEFVFRPIERFFEGKRGKSGLPGQLAKLPKGARVTLRMLTYLVISVVLANTFLAYFVGTDVLSRWVLSSPADHPIGFTVVVLVTMMMLFDFGFFREQLCIVACPYGRFQSVMLDRHSPVVAYDSSRGEPRGKLRRSPTGDIELPTLGDCVDCDSCVKVCPTGIDIRDGLQMECIHCAQCIDACNFVMDKVGKESGLIRYSSQAALEGGGRSRLRPRVFVYPLLLAGLLVGIVYLAATKAPADITIVRSQGAPFNELGTDRIANQVRLRIVNRTAASRRYIVTSDVAELEADQLTFRVEPGDAITQRLLLVVTREAFRGLDGRLDVEIQIADDNGYVEMLRYPMLGPWVNTPRDPISESGIGGSGG